MAVWFLNVGLCVSKLLTIPRSPLDGVESDRSLPSERRIPSSRSTQLQLLQRFSQPYEGMPRELRVFDDAGDVVASHRMTKPLALVGQCRLCDVLLPHADVSFRHVWLQVLGERLLAVDLQSRTGVRWSNGRQRFGWVAPGESLMIGPYRIQYLAPDAPTRPLSSPVCDSEQLFAIRSTQSTVMLEPLNGMEAYGSRHPPSIPIRRHITLVGSGNQCQIQLCDPRVSRVHCGLMFLGSELWVVDLLGKNGTRVNGTGVRLARLDAACELQVGPFHFAVHYPTTWSAGDHGRFFGFGRHDEMDSFVHQENSRRHADGDDAPMGAAGGFSEQFVMSLMDRMMDMHQQMMTQSQQQMLMMTQMLGAMQQSYRDVIQEEVRQLHEITREIQQLQAKLLENPADATPAPSPPSPDSVLLPMLMGALLQSTTPPTGASDAPSPAGNDSPPSPPSPPVAQVVAPTAPVEDRQQPTPPDAADFGTESDPIEDSFDTATSSSDDRSPASTSPVPQPGDPLAERQPRVVKKSPSPGTGNDVQHHVWLAERMHKLERERNGLLARIVQTLSGQGRSSD